VAAVRTYVSREISSELAVDYHRECRVENLTALDRPQAGGYNSGRNRQLQQFINVLCAVQTHDALL
jgi:hypothetical protein